MEIDRYEVKGKIITYNGDLRVHSIGISAAREDAPFTLSASASGTLTPVRNGDPGRKWTDLEITDARFLYVYSDRTAFINVNFVTGGPKDASATFHGNFMVDFATTASGPLANGNFNISEIFITGVGHNQGFSDGTATFYVFGDND